LRQPIYEEDINKDVTDHAKELEFDEWALVANQIEKIYEDGTQAVCPNYFGVKNGEILGIVGTKACGKSSLIKMMTMETPAS